MDGILVVHQTPKKVINLCCDLNLVTLRIRRKCFNEVEGKMKVQNELG
jgi:hypothetical protein